jgi:DNA-directed RNA polymerase specialized sigma24 family protein
MSKRVSEKVSLELTLLAALDGVHADVDFSEIAEIQDWSRAVRGKFHGATAKDASDLSNPPGSSSKDVSRVVLSAPSNVASHGNVQYSQMAIPQLIAACTSESSEQAWTEFVRRARPVILMAIVKGIRRHGNASYELVDDLSQEVYVKLCADNFRALKTVGTGDGFVGLVRGVASRVAHDYFRSAASDKRGGGEALEADHAFPKHIFSRDASSEPERKTLLREIDAILKTHAHEPNFARDYAIFWLYYRHGLTAKEIAASPGVELSVKGIETLLLQLVRQMKIALNAKGRKAQLNRSLWSKP